MSVNCSGDIDTFDYPPFQVKGDWENTCVTKELSFSGISYDDLLAIAVSACTSASTCLSSVTWSLKVTEDLTDVVYDGSTGATGGFWSGSTVTGGTPTDNMIKFNIDSIFSSLNYNYSSTNMVYYLTKPYGVTSISVDICMDISLSGGAGLCTGGTCSATCVTLDSVTYPALTSSSGNVFVIDDEAGVDDIDFYLVFSDDSVFDAPRNAKFRYDIYKYSSASGRFPKPIVYHAGWYTRADVPTNNKLETIEVDQLELDGDYIIKGYWEVDVTTEYRSELGDKINTANTLATQQVATYNRDYDPYFTVSYSASTPIFSLNDAGVPRLGALRVISFIADGTTDMFRIGGDISGSVIVDLNGVTMARNLDYTITGSTSASGGTITNMTFLSPIITGDVITFTYVSDGASNSFKVDTISVVAPITSGATGGQAKANPYYNTTEGKYEIYTTLIPVNPSELYVTVNGVTLANNIDYYQSISNPKRIILEGNLFGGDIINIYYLAYAEISDSVWFREQPILWTIARPPQEVNGLFTVEVSNADDFLTITQTATTEYVIGQINYRDEITFSGTVGQTYYYRVKNEKNYETMCGDVITSEAYSEVVPIIVRVNSINSY